MASYFYVVQDIEGSTILYMKPAATPKLEWDSSGVTADELLATFTLRVGAEYSSRAACGILTLRLDTYMDITLSKSSLVQSTSEKGV